MADKKMNQFTTASNGSYIYAEAADGSQVKITKGNLANVLNGLLRLRCWAYKSNVDRAYVLTYNVGGAGNVVGEYITVIEGVAKLTPFFQATDNGEISIRISEGIPKGEFLVLIYTII